MKSNRWRIIFDYDDTLIRHDTGKEFKFMAEYLGLECNAELKKQFDNFYSNMYAMSLNKKITMKKYEEYLHTAVPLLRQNSIDTKMFFEAERYKTTKVKLVTEGAYELLEYLISQEYYLCILTNWFYDEQVNSIRAQGLEKYFERIYTWDNFYAKPDERAFIRALGGTKPEENIMVGNNVLHDIVPAKKLGIYTFGVHLKGNIKTSDLPDVEITQLIDLKKYS